MIGNREQTVAPGVKARRAYGVNDSATRTNIFLQVVRAKALLFHPEFDGIDRIWRTDRAMFVFVGFDQRHQDFL